MKTEICLGQITESMAVMCGRELNKKYVVMLAEDTFKYPVYYWIATDEPYSFNHVGFKHMKELTRKEVFRVEV